MMPVDSIDPLSATTHMCRAMMRSATPHFTVGVEGSSLPIGIVLGSRTGTVDAWALPMRPIFPAAMLLAIFPGCGGAIPRGPNPADKSGGVTNMQPGSGGTYNDVLRTQGPEPSPPSGDTAPPTGGATPEPKKEPPPPRT
jgi:hypothetical protein